MLQLFSTFKYHKNNTETPIKDTIKEPDLEVNT